MAKLGRTIACCFIVSGAVGVLQADEPLLPDPGTRVRVRSSGPDALRLVGTLTAVAPENLTVIPEEGGEAIVVARQDVVRLERSVRPSRKTTGAWIGFGVGVAAAFGKVASQGGCNDGCSSSNVMVGALVALSAAAGGALIAPGETWADAPVPRGERLGVRVVPQLGRRVGLSIVASF